MKKIKISIVCMMLLMFIVAAVSLMFLNDTIPTHFDINGNPDQFGSKYFVLIFPGISLLIGVSMLLISKYAKVSDNYKKYMLLTGSVLQVMFLILIVIFILYVLSYVDEFPTFDISKVMMILFGLLFIIMGNFMPKLEKNSTLGLRTTWSMYNETTWQKSHRFTGFMGVIVGVLCLILSLFFNETVNFIILMSLILIFTVSTTVASYIYYKNEKKLELNK